MKIATLTLLFFSVTLTCYAGIVEDSGIQGGIVVHLNCGDGQATAEMAADNNCLIHGLDQDAGNISKAAESLGLSRAALYRRLEKYGIEA